MRGLLSLVLFVYGVAATSFLGGTQKSILIDVSKHNVASKSASDIWTYTSSDDWNYDDEGKSWKEGECANTENQSPVNFSTTSAAAAPDTDNFYFKFPNYETPVNLTNDGKALYAYIPNADGLVGGISLGFDYPTQLTVSYYIYKIVIHTPSEHTFNGKKAPLEVQLFHYKKDATLTNGEPSPADTAVVAAGFAESKDEASPFLRSLLDGGIPDQRGEHRMVNRAYPSSLDFVELMRAKFGAYDEKAGFLEYTGSLTQPPCSSGVRWFVRTETLNAKKETLDVFRKATKKSSGGIPFNSRALQVVGSRGVFPRFATDATQMQVFNIPSQEAFSDAVQKAVSEQSAFQKELGSTNAASDGTTGTAAHKTCLSELGETVEALTTARGIEQTACAQMDAAKTTLDDAQGAARIEAGQLYATAKKTCEDEQERVSALETDRDEKKTACDNLKSAESTTVSPGSAASASSEGGTGSTTAVPAASSEPANLPDASATSDVTSALGLT